jgi:hypothetical protein
MSRLLKLFQSRPKLLQLALENFKIAIEEFQSVDVPRLQKQIQEINVLQGEEALREIPTEKIEASYIV